MFALGQAGGGKAGQAINLPALLLVAFAHAALLSGTVSHFAAQGGAAASPPSLQVSLLPEVTPPLPSVASPLVSVAPLMQHEQPVPVSAPSVKAAPSNAGVPVYYPASALSRMPEVDGFFDVPVPPGLELNGPIELRLWIDAAGKLDRIAVHSSQVPLSYQQAVTSAFQRMRYRPGQIDGRPVAAFVDIVVEMSDGARPSSVPLP